MKCETIRNMISSYIDKDLNDIEKSELEKHIAECKECREEYENLLDIIAACGNLEEVELPQNFRTELHQRLVGEKKNFFSGILGKKSMKVAAGLVAAVLIAVIGIGSSDLFGKNAKMAQESAVAPGYGEATEPAAPDVAYDMGENKAKGMAKAEMPQVASINGVSRDSVTVQFNESIETTSKEGASNYAVNDSQAPSQAAESLRSGRMVIRTGNISVNVADVEKAATDIRQLTESSGGYVENSQIENISVPRVQDVNGSFPDKEATEKYANLTIRVPEAKFGNVFNNIKGMGKLTNENMSGSDITAEYRDTAARVDNLKIQEQSLKELMTKAKNVDEILRIESELNRVRTDIDIYSGNLKRWDNLVQLSTITIYMRELKPEELNSVDVPGMWGKAYKGFIKAVNNVVAGLEKTVIVLVTAIPYLVIAGVLAAIGFAIAKKIKLKK